MSEGNAEKFGGDKTSDAINSNCLAGKRCPMCGSYGPLEVQVSMRVLLYDEGTEDADDGSVEYDDHADTTCYACRYEGKLRDFDIL